MQNGDIIIHVNPPYLLTPVPANNPLTSTPLSTEIII
jgi:hypothetical protein